MPEPHAELLARARRSGVLLAEPLGIGSTAAALRVQVAGRPAHIGGYKCALPTGDRMILAPIVAAAIHRVGDRLRLPCPAITIEPEIAFTIGETIGAATIDQPVTRETIADCLAGAQLALELVHGRFADPAAIGFFDMLADDLFNEAVVLGPAIALDAIADIATITFDGDAPAPVAHPAGDPLAPLVWLANHLAAAGTPLTRGMVVITGALAPPLTLRADRAVVIRFGDAGTITTAITLGAKP